MKSRLGAALRMLFPAVCILLARCSVVEAPVPEALPGERPSGAVLREALWVDTDEVRDPARQDRLLAYAVAEGVNTLYLGVYRPEPDAAGRRMYEADALARLVGRAHAQGVEVWASYGNPDWPALGCRRGTFPYDRIRDVLSYNRAHPGAAFDGVILDVEPPDSSDLGALVALYDDVARMAGAAGLPVAAAIAFYWDGPVHPPGRDAARPAYEHILEADLDHVVVMGYRNFAGDEAGPDGILALDRAEIRHAAAVGRARSVVVGLRVTSTDEDGGHPKETFHGLPRAALERERRRVADAFGRYPSFGGFSTHRYRP